MTLLKQLAAMLASKQKQTSFTQSNSEVDAHDLLMSAGSRERGHGRLIPTMSVIHVYTGK